MLIIYALKGFIKEGKNNKLRASDIKKIADTVKSRETNPKLSRCVQKSEIRENDYKLNIPRYVDSSEKVESFDIYASMYRYRMVGYRSRLKISITILIDIVFPELPTLVWSIHQASSYAVFSELPSPVDYHLTKLTNLLSKASKGKYGKEKAVAFKSVAFSSIGSSSRSICF